MSRDVKPSVKSQRARATRQKIVDAAKELFIENGYLSTKISDIASRAGVATQTVYFVFGNKISIIQAVFDIAVAGDDEPVPVLERSWVSELASSKTPEQTAELLADNAGRIVIRAAPVYRALLHSAADPEIGPLLMENKGRRGESLNEFARLVCESGVLDERGERPLADLLYLLISEECYMLMTTERGWSDEEWLEWVRTVLLWELKKPR